ncbi:peptide-N(4)-(N-acetyl-beta-glucosaminyl)asparagine amidase [Pyxidicoccus parkwayensis]|uniref:Peptide-N(4)-(N-acetyl-beta-glucosaminyl)asparagine amidase n=1 Tax=Pyxidicoccus parkwayensis TaxID=2813578 RepID=A0ABX7P858_9BACT|nr:peptide-N4-asparagine amidase [Pyxidicoccus parkwaysis]QSQ26674.1 peptide-N(4)-(N-acetyl-beta-glucosaminyl)asparagine amidase [Pyxidicoccus parkwaysis]
MTRLSAVFVAAGLAFGAMAPAYAAEPPPEYGTDWDDPRTAAPPVAKPTTSPCTVKIVDEPFDDFTPYTSTFTPPANCPGPWSKVVLRMDGAVQGVQYDRLGHLEVGGVAIFKTSTPEPSRDGISWTVEKDVTEYAPLLSKPQPVWMLIGNVVNETYTGVLNVQVYLTFYPADGRNKPAETASDVLPLANPRREGSALVGDVTLPKNTERLVAEVYATGSGGGCEEFWYITAPTVVPYSCPADDGPYREVQIEVDGRVAGVAMPFPHVYTGGWSNPFLWYVLPAPRAFNIRPIRYDLTPFVGLVNDGQPHQIKVSVLGVPEGRPGWDLPTNVFVWRAASSARVLGGLLSHEVGPVTNDSNYALVDGWHQVDTQGGHHLRVSGWALTSKGRVVTTVEQTVSNSSMHRWVSDEENPDELTATWTDSSIVVSAGTGFPTVSRSEKRFVLDGHIDVTPENRLTTVLTMNDSEDARTIVGPGAQKLRTLSDVFTGQAAYTLGVPRAQRNAVAQSTQHYRLTENGACYDRTISQKNGTVTQDVQGCH